MTKRRILIVEDEAILRRIVKDAVEEAGHYVTTAEDGEEALRLFRAERPHLVIADIMLPKLDGFEMVRAMRKEDNNTQYLFLSARSTTEDVVEGFRVGGNDYLRKPFAIRELVVRMEALLSRLDDNTERQIFAIGCYNFDNIAQTLEINNEVRHLSSREAAILLLLIQNCDNVVSSHRLLMDIWGDDSYYNLRSMNVFISKLRSYLAKDKNIDISSVRGVGYKLHIKQ
jgi:DNA-binding response OmpR family regulator